MPQNNESLRKRLESYQGLKVQIARNHGNTRPHYLDFTKKIIVGILEQITFDCYQHRQPSFYIVLNGQSLYLQTLYDVVNYLEE